MKKLISTILLLSLALATVFAAPKKEKSNIFNYNTYLSSKEKTFLYNAGVKSRGLYVHLQWKMAKKYDSQ